MTEIENENEDDREIIVCARVENMRQPIYGSVTALCGNCDNPVWVSVSGQKAVRKNPALVPFCIECAFAQMSPEDQANAKIVPGAVDELKRHFSKVREN